MLVRIDFDRALPRYAVNHRNLTANDGGCNYAELHKHFP